MNNQNTEEAELEDRLLGSFSYLHFFHRELTSRELEGLESDIKILLAQLKKEVKNKMLSEERYIELESSFVYSKAILDILKEDGFDTSDLWNLNQKSEEASK